jgi:energy-coupling factor transporter ATP-binding protein EcfA2
MKDKRLETLTVQEQKSPYYDSVCINSINFKNYKFFYESFELPVNGENILLYGENGSGKSSVYKALELLTKKSFTDFNKNLNIFAEEGKEVAVEFAFSNGTELTITSDLEEIPDTFDFLNGLSIFAPMLDYKKLLRVHYAADANGKNLNLYSMFRTLLKDYPTKKGKLNDYKNVTEYFEELKNILENDLLEDINQYLKKYFNADIELVSFETTTEFDDETEKAIPIVHLNIDYKENHIEKYHTFLNEARLSSLAISIYLVTIKKLLNSLTEKSLKILVLDDLLISLDMSNRLKLLEILKNEFKDFQIFFFTHDKELYEIYKSKMNWKKYEIYLGDATEIPMPILKKGKTEIERVKHFYADRDYDACAMLLRKGFEKILKSYLTPQEQRNSNCVELDLSGLIGKAISKSNEESKTILEKLNSDRRHILNPLCHSDTQNIHSEELRGVIEDLEKLQQLLK